MIHLAASKNIRLEVIPFIEVKWVNESIVTQKVLAYAKQEIVVIFTSVQGVESVVHKLHSQKPHWRIACTSGKTERKVADYFGTHRIAATANNASELAKKILDLGVGEAVFFCGNSRRDELPDILKNGNVALTELVVYETMATPVHVTKRYDGILFFSPSAIKSFFSVNKLTSKTVLFAIGETTKESLVEFKDHKIISIDQPNKEDLVRLALQYFETPVDPMTQKF